MNNSNNSNTMEQNNTNNTNIFAGMDNAVKNFFGAIDEIVAEARKLEEKKMIFVITRTAHYKGEQPKGVTVVECLELDKLSKFGINPNGSFARGKFVGNHGRNYKRVAEMTVGTILKSQAGEYIQRIK